MDTFGVDFDEVADKPVVEIRNAARDYVPASEKALSYAREKLKKDMAARDALESMRDEEFIEGAKDLLAIAENNFKYLRSFKNVVSDYGSEVALNAHEAAQAEESARRKCDGEES